MDEQHQPWPLIFLRPDGTQLEISVAAWQVMKGFIQHASSAIEAGGVLLGRHLLGGSAIVVDDVTAPMGGDRRARTRFHRAQRLHQAAIDAAWAASDGTCTYLGEWHTHPEPVPSPSSVDWADWRRRLRQDRYTEPLFFIIAGTTATRVWEGRRPNLIVSLAELHAWRPPFRHTTYRIGIAQFNSQHHGTSHQNTQNRMNLDPGKAQT